VSLPPEETCRSVLDQLSTSRPTSIPKLETNINLGRTRLGTLLKILEVDGAVRAVKGGYILADPNWRYDHAKADRLRQLRREEADEMLAFRSLSTCRLRYLRDALDDAEAVDCGRCDQCLGTGVEHPDLDPADVAAARALLTGGDVMIEPRRQWPNGLDEPRGKIAPALQPEPGRALCQLGDGGWDTTVSPLFDEPATPIPDDLIRAIGGVLKRWDWPMRPSWICPIPSRRRAPLVGGVADAIGALGKLPVYRALVRTGDGGWQADQSNSAHQVANVWGRIAIDGKAWPGGEAPRGSVLLIDDEVDSRWTMTVCAALLLRAETGPVLPFALRAR